MKNLAILLLFSIIISSCSLTPKKIFVSPEGNDHNPGTKNKPLLSPEAAKTRVAAFLADNSKRDINIVFREGTYELSESLQFETKDGGMDQQQVVYVGFKSETVIFSGGREISDWVKREDGLWETRLDSDTPFEQLYIDGERATRARIPNKDEELSRWYIDSIQVAVNQENGLFDKFMLRLKDDGILKNMNIKGGAEIIIFKDWATLRKQVEYLDNKTGFLHLKPPYAFFQGNYNGLMAPYSKRFTAYLEGNTAFLDQPGEWALSELEKKIIYYPKDGQDIKTSRIIAPQVKTLVRIKGNKDMRVENLHFKNIFFHHAAYILPEFGHDGRQACFYYTDGTGLKNHDALIEEAIRIAWAENCSFTNCEIGLTGGNGIYITEGSRHVSIEKCEIRDIGGNGVMVGTAYDPKSESSALVQNVILEGCDVHMAGRHYDSAVGIWQGFAANCELSGNEVYDLPYTGISIGWQWNPLPTSSRENLVADNHIHDVMKMLGDGGGIYTLGYQPGTIIRNNEIHDILRSELNHASPNNGMFIDEGSSGYLVEGNHIYRVSHTCIRGHRAAGVELKNNTFEPGEFPAISHTPPYGAMIFANEDSTIVWPNPGWPKEWGYPDTITAFRMEGNVFK